MDKLITDSSKAAFKSVLLLIGFLFSSCWEKSYDYLYTLAVFNSTEDTLTIKFGSIYTLNESSIDSSILAPKDTTFLKGYGTKTISENKDIPYKMLDNGIWDTISIYRSDTLNVQWFYPPRDEPELNHDFFNTNSWESWLVDDNEGIVMFTIYQTDLY